MFERDNFVEFVMWSPNRRDLTHSGHWVPFSLLMISDFSSFPLYSSYSVH